jgi:hypothetical protein
MANGGVVTGDEAATRLSRYQDQSVSVIARWIVGRKVLSFPWRSELMVPLFQFHKHDMSLRPAVAQVISELVGALNDFELAQWFARPNGWLGGAEPVIMIEANVPAVVQAARACRHLLKG